MWRTTPLCSHQTISASRATPESARSRKRTRGHRARIWAKMRATSSSAPALADAVVLVGALAERLASCVRHLADQKDDPSTQPETAEASTALASISTALRNSSRARRRSGEALAPS